MTARPGQEDKPHKTFLNDDIWAQVLVRYMKQVRTEHDYSLPELSVLIEKQFGIVQTDVNLRNKFNRGNYSAQLFLMALSAMGISEVSMGEIESIYQEVKDELKTTT